MGKLAGDFAAAQLDGALTMPRTVCTRSAVHLVAWRRARGAKHG